MKLHEIHVRDPFILPVNGTYYLYGTRGKNCWVSDSPAEGMGFDVYRSQDLENWSDPIPVFEKSASFWADRNFWAPEVHAYGGKFYLFASFADGIRQRGTQILVSDSPDGTFCPLTEKPVTPEAWSCLDGTLYVDRNGKPHIVFCHEWSQIKDGEVCEMQLSDDLTRAVTPPRTLFKGSDPWWARKEHESYVTDGPFLYRGDSGRLYMIWSSFTDSGYVQAVSYSDNGDIDGNWQHDLPLLAEKDGGHGMIFTGFDGKRYLVLHRPNRHPDERPVLTEIEEKEGALRLV